MLFEELTGAGYAGSETFFSLLLLTYSSLTATQLWWPLLFPVQQCYVLWFTSLFGWQIGHQCLLVTPGLYVLILQKALLLIALSLQAAFCLHGGIGSSSVPILFLLYILQHSHTLHPPHTHSALMTPLIYTSFSLLVLCNAHNLVKCVK